MTGLMDFFFKSFWDLEPLIPLPSRFAVPAFLCLARDPPKQNVLGLSLFASLGQVAAASPSALPEKPRPAAAGPRGGLCHSSA